MLQSSDAGLNTKLKWLSKPLRQSAIRRIDGVQFSQFETIKRRRPSNLATGIARRDPKLVDVIRSVLSYADTFRDEYQISFSDARAADISLGMHPSNFLSKGSRSIYLHYTSVRNLMMKHKKLQPYVETLSSGWESRASVLDWRGTPTPEVVQVCTT